MPQVHTGLASAATPSLAMSCRLIVIPVHSHICWIFYDWTCDLEMNNPNTPCQVLLSTSLLLGWVLQGIARKKPAGE